MPAQHQLATIFEQDTVGDLVLQNMVGDLYRAEVDNVEIELIGVCPPATLGMTEGIETPTVQLDRLRQKAFVVEMNTEEAEIEVLIATFLVDEVGQGHLSVGMGGIEAVALYIEKWKTKMHTSQYREEMLETYLRYK